MATQGIWPKFKIRNEALTVKFQVGQCTEFYRAAPHPQSQVLGVAYIVSSPEAGSNSTFHGGGGNNQQGGLRALVFCLLSPGCCCLLPRSRSEPCPAQAAGWKEQPGVGPTGGEDLDSEDP